jgi:lipopolysaccharide export system protein LptC
VNRRQLLAAAALVLLLLASYRLSRQQDILPATDEADASAPDAYASDIRLDIMNAAGRREYQLQASSMEYYPDTDRLQLVQPRLELTRPGSHWSLQAESGYTVQSSDLLWLLGSVTIRQVEAAHGNPLLIDTRDVLVKPVARLAETGQPAHITSDGYQLDAIGFDADLNSNRVELRSRVRGKLNEAG